MGKLINRLGALGLGLALCAPADSDALSRMGGGGGDETQTYDTTHIRHAMRTHAGVVLDKKARALCGVPSDLSRANFETTTRIKGCLGDLKDWAAPGNMDSIFHAAAKAANNCGYDRQGFIRTVNDLLNPEGECTTEDIKVRAMDERPSFDQTRAAVQAHLEELQEACVMDFVERDLPTAVEKAATEVPNKG